MTRRPEAFDFPPDRFDSEHFGFHSIEDKCPRPVPTVVDDPDIREYAKKMLAQYLAPGAQRAEPEPLKDHEVFDPAEYDPGTLVRIQREKFYPEPIEEPDPQWREPYQESRLWGVVCALPSTDDSGVQRAIVPFIDFPAPGETMLEQSAVIDGPIRPGATYHTGTREAPSLTKIISIAVHPNIF